jgi:hypothetical protein
MSMLSRRRVIWLLPHSPTPPPISRPEIHRKIEKEIQLADGRGRIKRGGEKPSHPTARKPGPLFIIQYSPLGRIYFALMATV